MTTVSVIIPCYNYGRFLGQCLDSVLAQQGVDVQALIIDDASPDGSAETARDLSRRNRRIELVCHDRNMGHIATYNEGLERANGDYLLLLSADDCLTPGALARAAAVMDACPAVGLVYGQAIHHASEAPYAGPFNSSAGKRVVAGHRWVTERCEQMNNVVETPTAVVRTSLQHRVGGYRPDSPYAGDLEMWLRLAAYSDVAELDADQAIYRLHGRNMSVEWFPELRATFEHSRRAYETVLTEHEAALPGAARLVDVVRKQVARRALRMAMHDYCRDQLDIRRADWLESHALEVEPGCRRLPEWWALQVCKTIGPRAARRVGPAVDTLRSCSAALGFRS